MDRGREGQSAGLVRVGYCAGSRGGEGSAHRAVVKRSGRGSEYESQTGETTNVRTRWAGFATRPIARSVINTSPVLYQYCVRANIQNKLTLCNSLDRDSGPTGHRYYATRLNTARNAASMADNSRFITVLAALLIRAAAASIASSR